jgi:hypothetical protein
MRPSLKKPKAGDVAQLVKWLPIMCVTLDLIPSITRKRKNHTHTHTHTHTLVGSMHILCHFLEVAWASQDFLWGVVSWNCAPTDTQGWLKLESSSVCFRAHSSVCELGYPSLHCWYFQWDNNLSLYWENYLQVSCIWPFLTVGELCGSDQHLYEWLRGSGKLSRYKAWGPERIKMSSRLPQDWSFSAVILRAVISTGVGGCQFHLPVLPHVLDDSGFMGTEQV